MIHARTDYNRIQDPDGKIGDDEPVFLARAKDQAFVPLLMFYLKLTLDPAMREALGIHITRALAWQAMHGKRQADMPADAVQRDLFD